MTDRIDSPRFRARSILLVLSVLWVAMVSPVGCGRPSEDDRTATGGEAGAAGGESGAVPAEVVPSDLDGDGTEEQVLLFVDREGRLVGGEVDADHDGRADLWVTYRGEGAVEELAYDRDGDGEPDEWERFRGQRVTERRIDADRDGRPDLWEALGADGRIVESRRDTDGDGEPDVVSTHYPNGGVERAAYDTDGDGRADRWFNYGPDGKIASVQRDTDGDGIPDVVRTPGR